MTKKILIADDERSITDIIAYNLKKERYDVFQACDGEEAVFVFKSQKPDLVVLDVMMPKMNGLEACERIRQFSSNVPIIMLTAKADESDKIAGLELGADDYVTKPFSVNELMARIRANLRRVDSDQEVLKIGSWKLDTDRYEIRRGNKSTPLTPKEFELLKFLVKNPNKVFTREELLNKIWSYDYFGDARTVDVTIRRLRIKVENVPDDPKLILTKRGIGYYFEPANRK